MTPPEPEEGDAALYTGEGALIIAREKGGVEIVGKAVGKTIISREDGKAFIGDRQIDMRNLPVKLIDEMNLPALKGGVSCKRCIVYEVRSVRKLFNCGV